MLVGALVAFATSIHGQADQNLEIKGSTDCNDLDLTYSTMEVAETALHKANFNFAQEMNTTRISGYRRAHFRSCDLKLGFLLLQIGENWIIYRNVPLDIWNQYLASRDLEGFYIDKIKGRYPLVTEPL